MTFGITSMKIKKIFEIIELFDIIINIIYLKWQI